MLFDFATHSEEEIAADLGISVNHLKRNCRVAGFSRIPHRHLKDSVHKSINQHAAFSATTIKSAGSSNSRTDQNFALNEKSSWDDGHFRVAKRSASFEIERSSARRRFEDDVNNSSSENMGDEGGYSSSEEEEAAEEACLEELKYAQLKSATAQPSAIAKNRVMEFFRTRKMEQLKELFEKTFPAAKGHEDSNIFPEFVTLGLQKNKSIDLPRWWFASVDEENTNKGR